MAEAHRDQARWTPDYQIAEAHDHLFVAGVTRFPAGPFNSVAVLGAPSSNPEQLIERARDFFRPLDRGFTVYARAHCDLNLAAVCERARYTRIAEQPGMAMTDRPEPKKLAPHVSIRTIESAADASGFVDVVALAWDSMGMASSLTRKVFALPTRWLAPHWTVQVLCEHEQAVAGAMLLFSHGIAGVYWVGTVPSARGRGYADALVRSISNHAFQNGATAVILQASPAGEPVYRRLGYREITRYPWYLVPREPRD